MIGRTLALLGTLGYTGRHVFDVALTATMLENGIQTIYTYDERFSKMPGIIARTP
jgi:predicted nucleic acid-binding protein